MLTAERLREVLRYDAEAGAFEWIVQIGRRSRIGSRAGTIHNQGYRFIQIDGQSYSEHRLAFLYQTGDWPENEVDHINRKRADNRWKNLRDVTHVVNSNNIGRNIKNTSGFPGISWAKKRSKWLVREKGEGCRRHLGYFGCLGQAISRLKQGSN